MESAVRAIVEEFTLDAENLKLLTSQFIKQVEEGLDHWSDRGVPMIPTYVTKVPTGKETGTYLAADLGGTNFRVCSVQLLGDHKFEIVQSKWPIPHDMMVGKSDQFFDFLASRVKDFLQEHHEDHFEQMHDETDPLRMGFTFSFPVRQSSINEGTLLRWTKGFDIKDAVGKDVAKAFQKALDKESLKVHIAAIVNDTVGSLMARSYTNENSSDTVLGCIFGTGTNGAYFEDAPKITKLDDDSKDCGRMAINMEWGSFDNDLSVLPNTRFDKNIDKRTANPGYHMFEKRVSGMFLGELLREVLAELNENGHLFKGQKSEKLSEPWVIDTSVPSIMETDDSEDLKIVGSLLKDNFSIESTIEERRAVLDLAQSIGKRAAYLASTVIAGVLAQTDALAKHDKVDIGGDGSVFEFYPNFVENIRDAIRLQIGDDADRLTFGLAKDGSGVGAALCALEEGK